MDSCDTLKLMKEQQNKIGYIKAIRSWDEVRKWNGVATQEAGSGILRDPQLALI